MENNLQSFFVGLYVQFLLALWGFVLPLVTILISLFPEAIKLLAEKYKNEINQSETNLSEKAKSRNNTGEIDTLSVEKAIKELKKNKKNAERKLLYINPRYSVIKISSLFLVSVTLILVSLIFTQQYYIYICYVIGIIFLSIGLRSLWFMFIVLVEATEINYISKKEHETKTIELLTTLAEEASLEKLFVDPKKVFLRINEKNIKKESEYNYSINKQHSMKISVCNNDEKMLKNSELGFDFSEEFIIDEKANSNISLYRGEKNQIIRFNSDGIPADEHLFYGNLTFTPLKLGKYKVGVFFKAENLKPIKQEIELTIVE